MQSLLRSSRALQGVARLGGQDLDDAVSAIAQRVLRHVNNREGWPHEPLGLTQGHANVGGAGTLHVTGVGKSGLVGQRLAASLRSLSVSSTFTHAVEWRHGCLGALQSGDTVIVLSHSGTTAECVDACACIRDSRKDIVIAGIFSSMNLLIGRQNSANKEKAKHVDSFCDFRLSYDFGGKGSDGSTDRDDIYDALGGRCPTSSIIVQEALSNAILEQVIDLSELTKEDFAANHPA